MPLWGHISGLHFRLDCVLFWVTLRTIVFTDLRSVPGKWNLRKGRQHVGLSALVAVSDWMTGFIKYDKIRSEPWQVWSLSSAQSLASRASDETQFLDSAAVQEKPDVWCICRQTQWTRKTAKRRHASSVSIPDGRRTPQRQKISKSSIIAHASWAPITAPLC